MKPTTMENNIDKPALHQECIAMIQRRLSETCAEIDAAGKSAQSESKSTAGDKHDTARAMAHLEQEKYAQILAQQRTIEDTLLRMTAPKHSHIAGHGSVVVSTMGMFYIAAALGKCVFEGNEVFIISPSSPLAIAVKGMKAGDTFCIGDKTHKITFIF